MFSGKVFIFFRQGRYVCVERKVPIIKTPSFFPRFLDLQE